MSYTYKRKINYYETDKMGIVHHSNYIRFLEEARCEWLTQASIPMEKLESLGYTIPTLEVNCKYKYPVTSGDIIEITPMLKEYDGIKMTVSYLVINSKTNKTVVEASTKHCFTDMNIKPIQMKKHHREIHDIFQNLLETE